MDIHLLSGTAQLSNDELLERVKQLATREREVTVALIAHLAEHVGPHAAGGAPTADNIQLRCRAHSGYESERYFGRRQAAAVREPQACYSVQTEYCLEQYPSHSAAEWRDDSVRDPGRCMFH